VIALCLRVAALIVFCTALLGCAATYPPPPSPIDELSAALGLDLEARHSPLRLTSEWPEVVLFLRMEEGESIADLVGREDLIPSTLVHEKQVYLLNVPPGTYVAVAAINIITEEPTEIELAKVPVGNSFNFSLSTELDKNDSITNSYFSAELIEQTMTTVEPGSFAFMGRFSTNQSFSLGDVDELQQHFLHVIEGAMAEKSGFNKHAEGIRSRRLDPHKTDRSEKRQRKFFDKARERLAGSAWVAMMD